MTRKNSENNEIFSPEFIPYYIDEVERYQLTPTEGILYGFIRFYLKRENQGFYFTSQQIADILKTTANMINKSLTILERKGLIERETTHYSGGSKRLLRLSGTLPNSKNPPYQMVNSTLPNGKVKKNTKKEYLKKNNNIAKAIEQSSDDFLDYQKIDEKNLEEKNRENKDFSIPEESKSSGPDFSYMLSVQIIHTITKGLEYGDLEITMMHKFLLQCVGIDEFKESRKWQRAYAKHLVNWTKKNGKEELMTRMKGILEDPFKAKNCNSIAYFYNELKAYIHSPVVIPQKKSSNVTFG